MLTEMLRDAVDADSSVVFTLAPNGYRLTATRAFRDEGSDFVMVFVDDDGGPPRYLNVAHIVQVEWGAVNKVRSGHGYALTEEDDQ